MPIQPFAICWGILATAILVLAFYRKSLSDKEDDVLHVGSSSARVDQVALAKKLDKIDHWGKILTVVAIIAGLLLFVLYLYNGWRQTN